MGNWGRRGRIELSGVALRISFFEFSSYHPASMPPIFHSLLPVVFAGIATYVASKAMADALTGGDNSRPGWLAIGQWIPIAVLALTAALSNRPAIAVGLVFSTSVACLSLAVGAAAALSPVSVSPVSRRSWGMLVPAGLLAFLVGLHGTISLFNAGIFAIEGLCALMLWNDQPTPVTPQPLPVARPGHGIEMRLGQLVLGLALSVIGAWLGLYGVNLLASQSEFTSAGLMTATLLGPLLVLPIIGSGTELAHAHQAGTAVASQTAVALLNLCALLPAVVFAACCRQMFVSKSLDFTAAIAFPLAVWRVDVILVIILSLFLLPVSLGRWALTRTQGLIMMLGYVFYLMMTLAWQTYVLRGVTPKPH